MNLTIQSQNYCHRMKTSHSWISIPGYTDLKLGWLHSTYKHSCKTEVQFKSSPLLQAMWKWPKTTDIKWPPSSKPIAKEGGTGVKPPRKLSAPPPWKFQVAIGFTHFYTSCLPFSTLSGYRLQKQNLSRVFINFLLNKVLSEPYSDFLT